MHANFYALGAIALWATLASLGVTLSHVPPFLLTGLALVIGSVPAWPLARQWKVATPTLALGIYGLFGFHFLLFIALRHAPAVEANLVNYLWPLLIVLFSALLPGERLKLAHVAGALVGLAGVVVLIAGRGAIRADAAHLPGYLCAFAAAFVWSGYSVLSRRFGSVPTDAVAGFCLATAALSFLCHLAFEATVWPASPTEWLAILALGVGPVGAAFYVWDIGVKRGDIRVLGIASYAAPVLSTLILVLAGYAEPSLSLAVSCALIVSGAAVATLARRRTVIA